MSMSDVSLAVRMLARQRGLSLIAIAALALGIGLTTTMFSIINGVLLRGLPFPDADRLQHIATIDLARHREAKTSLHAYIAISQRQQAFEEVAASHFFAANVVGADGVPARYFGINATSNLFRVLRVAPSLGPGFREGTTGTVAISPRVWRERFNAVPNVIGRSLRVNGVAMTIVAVMPEKFGISTWRVASRPATAVTAAKQSR
jgi:hypothetical protein